MKLLTTLAVFFCINATAATLYLDDGSVVDLPVGYKVYVSKGTVWEFTRFNEGGFDIRPLLPRVEIEESCTASTGLTFGGASYVCEEVVVVTEEPEETEETAECDSLTFGGGC